MLSGGTQLGSYEILSPLGAGGMGEVYRARDLRLKREVAIKVLPDAFASDAERVSRLQREAEVLASLNHPNIAAIHQLDEFNGSRFLVLELVEGDTLAERVAHGCLPIDEALTVARQIADAFQAAHEKGIIHRDLKPANVKITPDGVVKVLDFGLAKIHEGPSSDVILTQSPTVVGRTQANVILGTAAYMSPEQARGQAVDRTSDIWAFGCVLYEMLTGRQAFSGDTITDILGGIVRVDPDWTALPDATPPAIRSLLRRCLRKDRKRRLKDIADASLEIEEVLSEVAKPDVTRVTTPAAAVPRNHERLAWAVAAGLLLLVSAVSLPFAVIHFREAARDDRPIRFVMLAPENATVSTAPPSISPDGRRLVFMASVEGKTQLWIRPIDSTNAQPLSGTDTDGAAFPFWSPDSRSVGFFAGGKLRTIDASGGPARTLCDAPTGRGGAWNQDGVIIFNPSLSGPLHRVSASGGASTPLPLMLSAGEVSHRGPDFLPDGRRFLFFSQGGDTQGIYLGSLETGERKLLVTGGSNGAYVAPGYLLFLKDRTLVAQRLDLENLELAGEAFPIAESVGTFVTFTAAFSASDTGVLAYSNASSVERQLSWFDRAGRLVDRIGSPIPVTDVALSPDQKRVAIQWGGNDIRVVDLVRGGVPSRLTFNSSEEDLPVWSPSGDRVLFNSTTGSGTDLYWKASSGAGNEEVVLKSGRVKRPTDWSSDGRFILYEDEAPERRYDLWVLPLFGDKKPVLFLQTPFAEQHARFSPNVKWIAYISDESGTSEVYVQSFPPSGDKWKVSANGGFTPRWRRDGRELLYLAPDRKIMSLEVRTGGTTFGYGSAKALFEAPVEAANTTATNRYDVSADGQRFLINAPVDNATSAPITVVVNWLAGVKSER